MPFSGNEENMIHYKGLPVSTGVAVGSAFCYRPVQPEDCLYQIEDQGAVQSFAEALEQAKEEPHRLCSRLEATSAEQAKIL